MFYCEKCNRTMDAKQFYGSNNLEKYPEGKLPQCKQCITMHVDNWDPSTYVWILKECDVPYIPDEWNKLMQSYAKDRKKVTGTTILGRYLSKMKLKQWREYRWKDTEFLQEMTNKRIEETMKRSGYDAQQIAEAINKATFDIPDKPPEIVEESAASSLTPPGVFGNDFGFTPPTDVTAEELGLTEEDQTFLKLKWGRAYKPEEWVRLEQLYSEMMESYDIQSAGHIDTLKLLCKTSLKCNQLVDMGDVEGFQKMSKVYDQLMKSGKFTAAQNKADQGEYVDSIAEFVEICETEGFIPRFYIDKPNDRVDETLLDIKNYTHTLVTEEMNLGNLIENAVKEMAKEEAKEEDEDIEEEIESYEDADALKEEDFEEYWDFIEDETGADEKLLDSLTKGE